MAEAVNLVLQITHMKKISLLPLLLILCRAVTAQTDQDSLPPYDRLDAILTGLIEEEKSVDELAATVAPREMVTRVQQMLYVAEYKRRQAPPGVKVSRRNFGRDRRYPITNRFRELK